MPIFEALKGSSNANETINYCEKEIILDPETGQQRKKCILKAGVNCDIADIREDFAETRHYFDKTDGRQAMHFVLSFHPKELPNTPDNYEKCLEIGMNLAAQIGKGHESGCFVHSDQEHLHCHIVTNSVNYENGRKFHMEKNKDLVLFRHISDQICKEHGIEPLESYKGEHVQEKNAEKRIKARGGITWKDEIREAISYAKERATNLEQYKELLAEKGVEIYQRGEKTTGYIHIARRDAGEKLFKLRDRNKALDDGYHLEDIIKSMARNKRIQQVNGSGTKEKTLSDLGANKQQKSIPMDIPSIQDISTNAFEETVQNAQEKKAAIKDSTAAELKNTKDEAQRIEIKRAEKFKLQQAELDKQIELRNQDFAEEMFQLLRKNFPNSTSKELEKTPKETSFYFGGATKKLYKVSYELDFQGISISRKTDTGIYEEQSFTPIQDATSRKKVTSEIQTIAKKQDEIYRRNTQIQRTF
ncbi:relaxase/mobilization nuclease domain-containing protein [Niallia taxi]|nr:relaxase/mobilization nuclease domain-containing protein [Niallia taxi]MDE5056007.1 relaxase/mobilization nuclease domain-containing protein [Niallia taxi]